MENGSADLEKDLQELKETYLTKKAMRDHLSNEIAQEKETLNAIKEKQDVLMDAKQLLLEMAELSRSQVKEKLENLVTRMLSEVFGSDIRFVISVKGKDSKAEVEFYIETDCDGEKVLAKPYDSHGGGVVDLISLALRFAMLQLSSPVLDGPLILDEPAKHVSQEYIHKVAELLKEFSEGFDRQIIMVTHNNYLSEIADKSYRVEQSNGISKVF